MSRKDPESPQRESPEHAPKLLDSLETFGKQLVFRDQRFETLASDTTEVKVSLMIVFHRFGRFPALDPAPTENPYVRVNIERFVREKIALYRTLVHCMMKALPSCMSSLGLGRHPSSRQFKRKTFLHYDMFFVTATCLFQAKRHPRERNVDVSIQLPTNPLPSVLEQTVALEHKEIQPVVAPAPICPPTGSTQYHPLGETTAVAGQKIFRPAKTLANPRCSIEKCGCGEELATKRRLLWSPCVQPQKALPSFPGRLRRCQYVY